MSDKSSALQDELLAIESIYPGFVQEASSGTESTFFLKTFAVELYINFPADYPAASPKISGVQGMDKKRIEDALKELKGQEVLFSLHAFLEAHNEQDDEVECDSSSPGAEPVRELSWTIGESVTDRKSVFLGRSVQITNEAELHAALEQIKKDKHLQKAAHPQIWACRYRQKLEDGTERLFSEYDDDGETAAGSRLAFLLEVTKADNVLVLVSRWFGGVLLGDVRFKHISMAARDALQKGGFLS